MDALYSIPHAIGRCSALKIEETFWALILANTGSFFAAGNSNLLTGAGSALSGTSLGTGVKTFLEQTDTQSKPIGVTPRFLLVPPALKTTADELHTSRLWNVGASASTDSTRVASANPFFGLYEPLTAPWIGANGLTSGTDTQWHLFGDPRDVAAFGVAYLDGRSVPHIEQVNQPPETLGISFRGWIDFGCCQIDHRGAVKSDGA